MKTCWVPSPLPEEAWLAQLIHRRAAIRSLGSRQTVCLGDVCAIESGQYIDEYVDNAKESSITPYIRVDNIRPFVANMNRVDLAYVRADHPAVFPRSILQAGDVVIARTGTLGKACLAVGELVGCVISQHVTRLTVRPEFREQVSPECLCAFLSSRPGRAQLLAGGAGSTRLELTHGRLADLQVPLLEKGLHRRLTTLIRRGAGDLAHAGAATRKAVDLYNAVLLGGAAREANACRQTWVRPAQVRERWLPRYHCLALDSVLEHVGTHFELQPLAELACRVRGKGTRAADYTTTGIPFVRTTSLINGGIDPFPDHYAAEETYTRYRQQTNEGDLLLSIEGKIGAVAYLTDRDRCVFKNHIELVRPVDRSLSLDIFLGLASEFGQAQMQRLTVVQATLPGLANRSRQILIPIPRLGAPSQADGQTAARGRECLYRALQLRKAGLRALSAAVQQMQADNGSFL